MRTTAMTGEGLVGSDWMRVTAVILDSGDVSLRRPDGTLLDTLPTVWRTCGDVTRMAAESGQSVNIAAIPVSAAPVHPHARKGRGKATYKAARTLRQHTLHMVRDAALARAIVDGLIVYYEAEEASADRLAA